MHIFDTAHHVVVSAYHSSLTLYMQADANKSYPATVFHAGALLLDPLTTPYLCSTHAVSRPCACENTTLHALADATLHS